MPNREQLSAIRFLLTDVDGVLTDGRILIDAEGRETKMFHVHDNAGIAYWHRHGGRTGFLSGRDADAVRHRAAAMGVHEVVLGRTDKADAFAEILVRQNLDPKEFAYIGDDLLDLPVLEQVGFAVTVPEARFELHSRVHWTTERSAGFGAVRDVIEVLLRARGVWGSVVERAGRS